MTEEKKMKVVFAPGCFDHFEGDQAELDSLIAEIHNMVETGEIFEKSMPVDMSTLSEDEMEILTQAMSNEVERKLQ